MFYIALTVYTASATCNTFCVVSPDLLDCQILLALELISFCGIRILLLCFFIRLVHLLRVG